MKKDFYIVVPRIDRAINLSKYPIVGLVKDVELSIDKGNKCRNGVICYNDKEKIYVFYDIESVEMFRWKSNFVYSDAELEAVTKHFGWHDDPATAETVTHRDIFMSGVSQIFMGGDDIITESTADRIINDAVDNIFSSIFEKANITPFHNDVIDHVTKKLKDNVLDIICDNGVTVI